MAAITLESDSNHSPPLLTKSNDRSSPNAPRKANNSVEYGGLLREFSQARGIIPRPFGRRSPPYKRKVNVVKIKNSNE
jgi:hypothetical protein